MRPVTVSIDDILTEAGSDMALTTSDRIALLAFGRALENKRIRKYTRRQTMRRLVRAGYVRDNGLLGFSMTEIGALRYRAERSHQEHCSGCSMCKLLRRARRP